MRGSTWVPTHASSDDFVYEYVGEVIPEHIFRERIKEYAEEGIQHFYFMMLQKGEVSTSRSTRQSLQFTETRMSTCSILMRPNVVA